MSISGISMKSVNLTAPFSGHRYLNRVVIECALYLYEKLLSAESIPRPRGDIYTLLSRRANGLSIAQAVRQAGSVPVHLVVDSTGLKIFGEGE